MHHLGRCYLYGTGVPKSSTRAAMILNFALRGRGFPPSPWTPPGEYEYPALRAIYEEAASTDLPSDEQAEVIRYLEDESGRNDAGAEYQLALCSLHGWGMPKSPAQALERLERAARLLEALRQKRVGDNQHSNVPTERAHRSRLEDKLFQYVLFEIGQICERGMEGVPADPERALACYSQCDTLRFCEAQRAVLVALARMYREGRGTKMDEEIARWYEERAERP
jgi:TPR repeat protein